MSSLKAIVFVLGFIVLVVSIVNLIYLQVEAGTERIYGFPTATPRPPGSESVVQEPTATPALSATPEFAPPPPVLAPSVGQPATEIIETPQETAVGELATEIIETPQEAPAFATPTFTEIPPELPAVAPMPEITETPVPFTPVPPTPLPSVESQPRLLWFYGTHVPLLGTHVLQPHEHLFCIGRAYGVQPQAIAEVNSLALNAVLYDGQELQIPDVPWINIPPGPVCTPQFESPYSPASVSMINTSPSLPLVSQRFSLASNEEDDDGSISEEFRLINFVLPKERVKKEDSQLISLHVTLTSMLTGETRRVKIELPDKMFLGASGVVKLTFYPDPTSQPGESGPTSPGQNNATPTNVPEPSVTPRYSEPIVIPDVFDNCYISAIARLDAAGFSYSPLQDNTQPVYKEVPITWYWSIKPQDAEQQKLVISLRLHYEPKSNIESKCENGPVPSDNQVWTDSFTITVRKTWFDSLTGSIGVVLGLITTSLTLWESLFNLHRK